MIFPYIYSTRYKVNYLYEYFSKISTFVSFYYFSKCNIYASTLSKGNDLFLLFIFFPARILSRQQFKGMIQIHLPIPPLRVWVLHVFFSSCAPLQIIFHAAPSKKRLVIPYDRPFKQKCRDTGGLCGGDTGPGAGSKAASYQRHFYVNARSCQMWSDPAIWRIALCLLQCRCFRHDAGRQLP